MNNEMILKIEKNAVKNGLSKMLETDRLYELEFYRWDLTLRLEMIYKYRLEQLTGFSVERQLVEEQKERRATKNANL